MLLTEVAKVLRKDLEELNPKVLILFTLHYPGRCS
jgi:hypothetical protein